jgi:hypothetical protein
MIGEYVCDLHTLLEKSKKYHIPPFVAKEIIKAVVTS